MAKTKRKATGGRWSSSLSFIEGDVFVSRADVSDYVNEGDKAERAERVKELAGALGVSVRSAQRYVTQASEARGVRGFIGTYAEQVADALGIDTRIYRRVVEIHFQALIQMDGSKEKPRWRGMPSPIRVELDEEQSDEIQDAYFSDGESAAVDYLIRELYGLTVSYAFTILDARYRVFYEGEK